MLSRWLKAMVQLQPRIARQPRPDIDSLITVPIGAWRVLYKVQLEATRAVSNPMRVMVTLSTANNSESNTAFTQSVYNPYTTIVFLGVNMIESLQLAALSRNSVIFTFSHHARQIRSTLKMVHL
jgi:hypothetical protein